MKSNEAAISRFSSQDSKPLKKREEKKILSLINLSGMQIFHIVKFLHSSMI